MSEKALRDLNMIPGLERRNGTIAKSVVSNTNGNAEEAPKKTNGIIEEEQKTNGNGEEGQKTTNGNGEEGQKTTNGNVEEGPTKTNGNMDGLKKANGNNLEETQKKSHENLEGSTKISVDNGGVGNSVPETGVPEVEYIESENLNDVEDVDTSLKTLLAELESKDWVLVCEALNNVRRLSLFHKETLLVMLVDLISLVAKSLKNPRSAVIKTAILASADIFNAYNDQMIESLDPLLVQLLLKSSQDKRFVCEAADKALVSMTTSVSPLLLLPKLQPYLKHRNPRIRAKASICYCRSVPRLGVEGIKVYGIENLIRTAASQLSDQLPESREAARTLVLELQNVYQKSSVEMVVVSDSDEATELSSWANFCQAKLSPLSAQAVLRVTNVLGS